MLQLSFTLNKELWKLTDQFKIGWLKVRCPYSNGSPANSGIPSQGFLDFWKICACDVDTMMSMAEDLVASNDGSDFSGLQYSISCIVGLIFSSGGTCACWLLI